MKKMLLSLLCLATILITKAQKITAYAITGVQKGSTGWTEVRLIDMSTGEEMQPVFQSAADAEILNARTGKALLKKADGGVKSLNKPFATNSAACAYDKKHNRLYYTPLGIAQLRYIDLKAKTPKVFYFEDEPFGVVKGRGDAASQITRMVIASDGKGYALTNDATHLIRFATKKKQEITDVGTLTDDAANGKVSVHAAGCFGGDIIADNNENLYLIGANRSVFKIGLETKVATYIGQIKNLPRGYSTNGAVAEGNSNVIVSSSNSTQGYYRFDLNTLESEKISGSNAVFNASDLANGALAFEKKDKEASKDIVASQVFTEKIRLLDDAVIKSTITVYPNPVTDNYFRLTFADQAPGRYQIQLMDISGKIISTQQVTISSKMQIEEFRIAQKPASGNYLVKVMNETGSYSVVNKVVVQ